MLWLIKGGVGTGKSLFLTICAFFTSVHKNIFANFNLNIPERNVKKFSIDDMFSDELSDGELFLDEIYTMVDSRTSMSDYNKVLSYILFQSRKKGLNIFCAFQIPRSIDIRFREMADYIVKCESNEHRFIYTIINVRKHIYRRLTISREKASFFYTMFDTRQIISSEKTINLKEKVISREKMDEIIKSNLSALHSYLDDNNIKLSKQSVQYFCKRNNLRQDNKFVNEFLLEAKFNKETEGVK